MKRDVAGIAGASGRLNVVRTTYDALGRAVRTQVDTAEVDAGISIEGTRLVERGYDGLGRAVRASNEVCAVTATYDSLGRALAEATTPVTEAEISTPLRSGEYSKLRDPS
ncbi:MAG: hypothetical protein R3B06_08325 [Kofleriaceae bacterium]